MNLREVDRLVAEKVMDWVQGEYAKDKWYYKKNGQIHGMAKFVKDWNPSTNIADAWQVAEKFYYQISSDVSGNVIVDLMLKDNDTHKIYRARAETAPLAICLAALKAVGIEVEVDD